MSLAFWKMRDQTDWLALVLWTSVCTRIIADSSPTHLQQLQDAQFFFDNAGEVRHIIN
jgi:hypothetical protein